MNDIQIFSPAGQDIRLTDSLPSMLNRYRLSAAGAIITVSDFGHMYFQHVAGAGFDIWCSTYAMNQPITLKARGSTAVLELTIPFRNHFSSRWDGIVQTAAGEKQFDLSFTPFIETEAMFPVAGDYQTFDIHYHKETLQQFASYFPALSEFLEKVEKGTASSLFQYQKQLTPSMLTVISEIVNYDFIEPLAPAFYESKCIELLIYMLRSLSGKKAPSYFAPYIIEQAREAASVILASPGYQYTAMQLAKKVGMNIYTLKTAFRQLYGCSLFRYSEQARMEYAKQLLLDHKLTVSEVALRVGYPDVQNFSIAFKRVYKINPGSLRNTR